MKQVKIGFVLFLSFLRCYPLKTEQISDREKDARVEEPRKDAEPKETEIAVFPCEIGGEEWRCKKEFERVICQRDIRPTPHNWTCEQKDKIVIARTIEKVPLQRINKCWKCGQDESGKVICTRTLSGVDHSSWQCKVNEFCQRICIEEEIPSPKDLCVPGQKRWCDGPEFCAWGTQICRPDGTFANPEDPDYDDPKSPYRCKEDLTIRPNNKCGCRSMIIFNEACCEDQEDRDGDGHPDCLIPADHKNPECKITGKLCSYCTKDEDCGGPQDLCIFYAPTLSLYCGRDCSNKACPKGYICNEVRDRDSLVLMKQCVPTSGSCENY
jgi:hypothetical protein